MKITLLSRVINIVEVETRSPLLVCGGLECFGIWSKASQTIYLDESLPFSVKLTTLKHELTHAVVSNTQAKPFETLTLEELCDFVSLYAEPIFMAAEEYFNHD